MRLSFIVILLTSICLTLTGCWDRTELNDLSVTTATGFDRQDDKWFISFQVVIPSATPIEGGGGGGSQAAVHVFTTSGKTILEAANNAYFQNARRLYFAHTDIMVIGKEAAEYGIKQIMDLYFRNADTRETVILSITDGKASDALRKLVPTERYPGEALASTMKKQEQFTSYFPVVRIYQFAQKILSDAGAAGIPEISLPKNSGKDLESIDIVKRTSAPDQLAISRLGVFRQDRLIGWIKSKESLGISFLTDQVKGSTIPFTCTDEESKDKISTFRLLKSKSKVTAHREGEHFRIQVKIKTRGELLEVKSKLDLENPDKVKHLEKDIEQEILRIANRGWEATKKLHADLPGFANVVHRKFPKEWKKVKDSWDEEELHNIKLDVQVKVTLQRPGLLKKSFEQIMREKEEG